jgi:hypothetical protein
MISGSVGIAVVGSILSEVYSTSFREAMVLTRGIPAAVTEVAGDSVGAAVVVAQQLPHETGNIIIDIARQSFMDGWQITTLITCGVSVIGAFFIMQFMPAGRETKIL